MVKKNKLKKGKPKYFHLRVLTNPATLLGTSTGSRNSLPPLKETTWLILGFQKIRQPVRHSNSNNSNAENSPKIPRLLKHSIHIQVVKHSELTLTCSLAVPWWTVRGTYNEGLSLGFAGDPKRQLSKTTDVLSSKLVQVAHDHLTQAFFTWAKVLYALDHIFWPYLCLHKDKRLSILSI